MKKDQLEHIANKHYSKLSNYLKKISKDFDPETIHQFRVEYKKLRAFFRMISIPILPAEINVAKNLKKIYRIAGNIRDLQLQKENILEPTPDGIINQSTYLHLIDKKIKKGRGSFLNLAFEKPVLESKKKTAEELPRKITTLHYKLFIHEKWKAIDTITLSKQFSDENVHTIRKNLKDLFYNQKLFNGVHDFLKEKDEAYFHQLLQDLGHFQDTCVAIELLKQYLTSKDLEPINKETLKQLKTAWIKDKANQKKILIKKLTKDLNF